jgi:multidrug transporter EmrE-like cation transporter
MPAITALAVWMIYGEAIPAMKWLGIVIVIVGLFVSQGVDFKR